MERKDIVIINTWTDTLEKELDLINLITTIKKHFPVCISSHYPISTTIQQLADLAVYDADNSNFPLSDLEEVHDHELAFIWYGNDNFYFQNAQRENCSFLPTATLVINAMNVCMASGYTHCFFTEYDNLFDEKDMHVFYEFREKSIQENTCGTFIHYNHQGVSEPFWYVDIKYYLDKVPNIRTAKDLIKCCRVSGETSYFFWSSFMKHYLYNNNGNISLLDEIDNSALFPNSIINKQVRGNSYGYMIGAVIEENTENIYAWINAIHTPSVGLRVEILCDDEDINFVVGATGLICKQVTSKQFLMRVYNKEDKKIDEKFFRTKDVIKNKVSYIRFF